jgi:ABC-type antimicrobial peptide transport system permease subunit
VQVGTMTALQVRDGYAGSLISMTGRMVGAGTVIALLLAAFGIVAVVREGVTRRTREIGLRVALGARAHQVVGIAALESALTTSLGVALGLAVLYPLGDALSGLALFRFEVDRLTEGVLALPVLGVAIATVVAGAAVTAVASAVKATRIDPAEALRSD